MKITILNGNPDLSNRDFDRYLETLQEVLEDEGIRMQPRNMPRKLFARFEEIGRVCAQTGGFDPHLLRRRAKPECISPLLIPFIWLLSLTGLTNFYWDMMLKENKAYGRRFAQPYCE